MQGRGHPIASRFRLKLVAFGTGFALGSFLISAVSLPLFFAFSVKADSPETSKYRGVEIKPQTQKPAPGGGGTPSPGGSAAAGGPDPDDFIEGNYWALIIGVNKYPNMDKDKQLEAARKDAEAVAKLLTQRYGFSKERMVELYDEAASRKGILRAFNSLKRRLTDKDSLFIYYAGHGEYEESKDKSEKQKRVDGMGYWIPSDAELDDPSSYIFNSQVRDYLANIDARHIFAVVDSCFSGSLMGRSRALGLGAIKELYQAKSRWVLASGGLYPVPDVTDKNKGGHSTFAWHFMKFLDRNTQPYVLAKDIANSVADKVSNDVKDQLPRAAAVVGAGDDGGQFVFRLKKEFLVQTQAAEVDLDEQLRKAEEALKKQQEEMAKRKQAMLEKIRQAQEQAKSEAEAEEKRLVAEIKAAEEKTKRDAEERQARLKADEERARKAEEERLAVAKKFEEEQKERERKAKEAELARQKIEEERKAEEVRLAELKRQAEEKERQRLAEAKRKEEERKAEEARLATELKKREEEEKTRVEAERKRMEELRKKQEQEKDVARLAELKRQEEDARKAEAARRKAEDEKIAEQKRQAEEKERQRLAELKRQDEERKAEETRLTELKRQAEEKERQRLAELKRQEEERRRIEAESKTAKEREEQRLAELKQKQEGEEKRLAEERRKAEEKRLADEGQRTEREKQALLKRQQDEEARRKTEQERLAALAREAEEQKRKIEEQQKALQAQKEGARPAKVVGEAPIVEATLRPFQAPKAKDLATVVTIPAGEFVMGSKPGDGQPDESPQRTVYLDAYTMDKFEVTLEQYAAYMKKAGVDPPDFWERANHKEDGNRPVVGMDWLEASEYCEYYGKRLPTEAQWEKAARGTDGRKFPWGSDDPGPLFANFASGVAFSYGNSLKPVGSYEAGKSPYGIYDMLGNVWEWVLDNYDKGYYQIALQKNPAGPASSDYKVMRGGSWAKKPAVPRIAGRAFQAPSYRANFLGFRCAGEAR